MRALTRSTSTRAAVLSAPLALALLVVPSPALSAGRPAPVEGALGLQLAGKAAPGSTAPQGTNPFLGLLPDVAAADYTGWKRSLDAAGARRAGALTGSLAAAAPLLVDEQEPAGVLGGNDTRASAQRVGPFGTDPGERPAARVLGTIAPVPPARPVAPSVEDDGSIPLAGPSGLTGPGDTVLVSGTIGDGPHGVTGDGTGDFDVYAVRGAVAGQELLVDVDTPTSTLDSLVAVYDAQGNALAGNDDEGGGVLDSLLTFPVPSDGDYFVLLAGFRPGGSLPADPFDSGSGQGSGSVGAYQVTLGLDAPADTDFYSVVLAAGDVLGMSGTGGATSLTVYGPGGREDIGSRQDLSGIYPAQSPLPGGGNAVLAHVADRAGLHTFAVRGTRSTTPAGYSVTVEAYRPGLETRAPGAVQTLFLDFDGARLNTNVFGGPGVRALSPFDGFLGRWGLGARDRDAVIDRVVATARENLDRRYGGAGQSVRILNSRDHRDPFGAPGVSRVVVGGTIAESGINTIGIAQSIDPGNYATEETALVLLDVLSDPVSRGAATLNTYLRPESDRVRFVGTAVGNVVSHEAGHFLGSFHVDQFNDVLNLMDQGGNFPLLYAVGADGVGGTADDPDVDFGLDEYNPNEGLTGLENTLANTRWALSERRR